jgi:hypothetical protein
MGARRQSTRTKSAGSTGLTPLVELVAAHGSRRGAVARLQWQRGSWVRDSAASQQ